MLDKKNGQKCYSKQVSKSIFIGCCLFMFRKYKTRLCRHASTIENFGNNAFDSDEFREIIDSLERHHHKQIYIMIIDYNFTQKASSVKKECKIIPYKGKSLSGKKRDLETNILYNLDNMPKELQSMIINYVRSIS